MKKIIFFIYFLVISNVFAQNIERKIEKEKSNISQDIKNVLKTINYTSTDSSQFKSEFQYDILGNLIEILSKQQVNGKWENYKKTTLQYNSQNLKNFEKMEIWEGNNWKIKESYHTEYNQNGQIINEEEEVTSYGDLTSYTFEYDDKGNIVNYKISEYYDNNWNLYYEKKSEFDNKNINIKTSVIYYYSNDTLININSHYYIENKIYVDTMSFIRKNKLEKSKINIKIYDQKNNLENFSEYEFKNNLNIWNYDYSFEYDDYNRMIKKTCSHGLQSNIIVDTIIMFDYDSLNLTRTDFYYNQKNQLFLTKKNLFNSKLQLKYSLTQNINSINLLQDSLFYNSNDSLVLIKKQKWINNKWENYEKSEYKFDEFNNKTYISDLENWELGKWMIDNQRFTYKFDNKKNILMEMEEDRIIYMELVHFKIQNEYNSNSKLIKRTFEQGESYSDLFYFDSVYYFSKNIENVTYDHYIPCFELKLQYEDITTNINESNQNQIQKISVFPNPSNKEVYISLLNNEDEKKMTLKIIDVWGEVLSNNNYDLNQGNNNLKINTDKLKNGTYLFDFEIDKKHEIKKIQIFK